MIYTRLELRDFSGLLQDLTTKLSTDEGEIYLKAVKMTLRGENPYEEKPAGKLLSPIQRMEVWETIKIGQYKDRFDLYAALWNAGNDVAFFAQELMESPGFMLSQGETKVDLWRGPASELGFVGVYTITQLLERAENHYNLERCQGQDGPYLREHYHGQTLGDCVRIGMDPIRLKRHSSSGIFELTKKDEKLQLGVLDSAFGFSFSPEAHWVFRIRK